MIQATHFIDADSGAWVKGVPQLIPGLRPGGVVFLMKDKGHGYGKHRYMIRSIETVIGDGVDSVLQDVTVTDLGIVEEENAPHTQSEPCTTDLGLGDEDMLRVWKFAADYVLTHWMGIGQRLDSPLIEEDARHLLRIAEKFYTRKGTAHG